MHLCYIDEAGDTGLLKSPTDSTQPVLAIAALFISYDHLRALTEEYLEIKRRLFPGLMASLGRNLDHVLPEIKGSELRKDVAKGTRSEARHAIHYLDEVTRLLVAHEIRLVARIWIKGIGLPFDGRSVYTSSIQAIYAYFQGFLESKNDFGFVIADSRNKGLNVPVSHSIFTQKFRAAGDAYNRVYELPTFAHSDNHVGLQLADNHVGLQLADNVSSALLYPVASFTYCTGLVDNVHVQPQFVQLKNRYMSCVKDLQHRYQDVSGKWTGGIVVSDALAHRAGSELFH
jgi:hypothetical protein